MDSLAYLIIFILFLPPSLLCLVAINLIFPRNILKIPAILILPLAISFVLLFNLASLYEMFQSSLNSCGDLRKIPTVIISRIAEDKDFARNFLTNYFWCIVRTVVYTYLLSGALRRIWVIKKVFIKDDHPTFVRHYIQDSQLKNPYIRWPLNIILSTIRWVIVFIFKNFSSFVERFILHRLAVLTFYDASLEELMVDVRTSDELLFSGKFDEYFIDGTDMIGISLNNGIKYDLRDTSKVPSHYIIPNNGTIYFPSEKIADLHFWHLKKNSTFSTVLIDERNTPRLAWFCSLQYALPKLNIKIVVYVKSQTQNSVVEKFKSELARCGLTPKDVRLSFQQIP